MQILYFAWVREKVGLDGEMVDLPTEVTTVGQAIDWLAARDADHGDALADRARIRAALDQRFVGPEAAIAGAHELALFPPVTGG